MSNVSSFNSTWAMDKFGSNMIFNVTKMRLHSPSEHTINGKRFDLEMVVEHLPNENRAGTTIKGATAHVFFDVERGTNITEEEPDEIESFFESLHLDYGASKKLSYAQSREYDAVEVYL